MFRPVNNKVNLTQVEENILNWWRENKIFQRSVAARRAGSRFVLYEGPPTANGNPGIHHILARVFKDIIPRYKVMKGYYAPRIAGWDTHGLPVELEVERELGFSGKAQIEEYGIEKFNARCKENVFSYLKEWKVMTERIGFWVDLEHPYTTMDNKYIESVWWAIKRMWEGGLVYQGYRVTPHCPRCGTSLSSHEVALGYQDDVEDPSAYIQFKVVPSSLENTPLKSLGETFLSKPGYLLAWTTTPWTLLANTALAVDTDAEYAVVELDNEYLILASARVEQAGIKSYKVVERLRGTELVGLYYEPLYSIDIHYTEEDKSAHRVIKGDFVSMEDGTGIVHIAPAYGEIDFEVGEKEGLPLVHTVELNGMVTTSLVTGFTPMARECIQKSKAPVTPRPVQQKLDLPGAGKFVKDADPLILDDLKSRNLLYRSEKIRHTYPFCWRCEAPLLYYAKQTWYIRTTAVKESLISGNTEINWYPEHIKYGRFGDWLENNVDWAFSRERYWGTPLNIWHCESCSNYECPDGVEELKNKPGFAGLKEPLDLHRPFVDELTFDCSKCGDKMRRVPEVVDCWFDSGAMPIAQYHYPFENDSLLNDGRFPADYICEAVDQTRGWFYSLHAISTLLFNRSSFRNVICLGHILDAKGEKMSKAKGNVVEPWAIINEYGADALRWYFLTSSPPGHVRRFSEKLVGEITRRFLLTLWNVYSFFVTYANIDRFNPSSRETSLEPSELDRWIISELNQLTVDVDTALEHYDPTEAGRKIESFVDELSNWYVRRSRRRFWKSENDEDKLVAYTTLYQCLVTLSKLLAPFTPFLADELYQNLVGSAFPEAPVSVHLADFPIADTGKINKQLTTDTRLAIKISSLGRAARSQAGIKVRQPLASAFVSIPKQEQGGLGKIKPQVLEELNVKNLELVNSVDKFDKPDYVISAEGDYAVAIPIKISPELQVEGMAREIVHRLQTMRRSAGFNITDHITTYYQGDAYMKQVMDNFAGYIKQETLSRELIEEYPAQDACTESYKLGGYNIFLGVKKIN